MFLVQELFECLFDGDALKPSSPRMTPFEKLPEHRRQMILPVPSPSEYINQSVKCYNDTNRYFASIEQSDYRQILKEVNMAVFPPTSDLVVMQKTVNGESSRAVHIKLTFPNGWSAENTIGRSFDEIHEHITNHKGQMVMPNPELIVDRCIQSTGMERIGAISFRENNNLNRHPDFYKKESFESGDIFMRFERQGIMGVPKYNAFVFTIQTYFVDLSIPENAKKVLKGIELSGDKSYARDILASERGQNLIERLKIISGQ